MTDHGSVLVAVLLVQAAAAPTAFGPGAAEPVAASTGAVAGQAESTPVVAQASVPGGRVLLDVDSERVASVDLEGTSYRVVRYENVLPYASGVEIYDSSGRVTSAGRAERVLRALAWQRASRNLGPEDVQTLRDVEASATEVEQLVTPPLRALDAVLGVVQRMKELSVMGTSAWDVATTKAPQLETFVTVARELRDELRAWKEAASAVTSNVPAVVDSIQRLEAGEEVDYGQLSERFAASMRALDELRTQSEQLRSRVADAADTSSTIAANVGGVPVIGGEAATQFRALAGALGNVASRIGSFSDTLESQRSRLSDVRRSARSQQDRLTGQYRNRQSAQTRVYGTIGGLGLSALVLVGGVLHRRRSRSDAPADPPKRTGGDAAGRDGTRAETEPAERPGTAGTDGDGDPADRRPVDQSGAATTDDGDPGPNPFAADEDPFAESESESATDEAASPPTSGEDEVVAFEDGDDRDVTDPPDDGVPFGGGNPGGAADSGEDDSEPVGSTDDDPFGAGDDRVAPEDDDGGSPFDVRDGGDPFGGDDGSSGSDHDGDSVADDDREAVDEPGGATADPFGAGADPFATEPEEDDRTADRSGTADEEGGTGTPAFCPNCGTELDAWERANFCPDCGGELG